MIAGKQTKPVLCLLMACIIMMTLAACSKSDAETNAGDTTAANAGTETAAETEPVFAEADYGGATLNIVYPASNYYTDYFIFTDKLDGEVVNDAVYNRNAAVSSEYNIVFSMAGFDCFLVGGEVKKMCLAGDSLDMAFCAMNSTASMAAEMYSTDLNTVSSLDLSNHWWDSKSIEQLSIKNRVFMAVSDISMTPINGTFLCFFNKYLVDTYNLDDPYDRFDANEWTYEYFESSARAVSSDLNGDGKWTAEDRYGTLDFNVRWMSHGFDIHYTAKDKSDAIVTDFMNDRTVTVLNKLCDLLLDKTVATDCPTVAAGQDTSGYDNVFLFTRATLFTTDHFLYMSIGPEIINSVLRGMEHDFGLMPYPKYDASQEDYYMTADPNTSILSFPITNTDPERSGVIAEYWAYLSGKTVVDAYYEVTLKNKITRDEKAAEILDIIRRQMNYEFTYVFETVSFYTVVDSALKNRDFASKYDAKKESIQSKIDSFNLLFT